MDRDPEATLICFRRRPRRHIAVAPSMLPASRSRRPQKCAARGLVQCGALWIRHDVVAGVRAPQHPASLVGLTAQKGAVISKFFTSDASWANAPCVGPEHRNARAQFDEKQARAIPERDGMTRWSVIDGEFALAGCDSEVSW